MEFLKKMKSREMIEMSLKTVFGVIIGLILMILMEGMIYTIYMNKIEENKINQYISSQCVAYCEEVSENQYKIYLHNTDSGSWHIKSFNETKESILSSGYEDVVFHKPNAFDVSITTNHYIVMVVFMTGVLGFYGWRFYRIDKEYKAFEKKYKKTGKIFS